MERYMFCRKLNYYTRDIDYYRSVLPLHFVAGDANYIKDVIINNSPTSWYRYNMLILY